MNEATLLYVYDALCGWCYGFSPVLGRLLGERPDLSVRVVSGGMIRGERRGPIGEVAAYIKSAYKDVERATGVRFGESFVDGPLERGDLYMTSEPPAALLAWVREQAPDRQYAAAHALQTGIYYHGYGPGSTELARFVAREVALSEEEAVGALTAERYAVLAKADFGLTAKLGVRGFPALFLVQAERAVPVANGYAPYEQLVTNVERAAQSLRS